MTPFSETILCDGCGVEITWSPIIVGNHTYCCQDCRDGVPCNCGDWQDAEEYERGNQGATIPSLPY